MKLSDYVMKFLKNAGVSDIFMLPGGGNMHLAISLMQSEINCVQMHHELSAGMAGVAYARKMNDIGVILVTSGPGGTHLISSCVEAYQSSTPCIFISGQVVYSQTIDSKDLPIRQVGVQETNIVPIVKSITKYATMVKDPNKIKYYLGKAMAIAKSGRPGPVWLDIPIDIQGSQIDIESLEDFSYDKFIGENSLIVSSKDLDEVVELLKSCKRPVILAGQGVRISKGIEELKKLSETCNIPIVTTYLGLDCIESRHVCNMGCVGFRGTRFGNLAVQNADVLICVGSRLSMGTTGYNYKLFAREAKIIVIDVDKIEHKKNTANIYKFINLDANIFLNELNKRISNFELLKFDNWLQLCASFKLKYPSYKSELKVNNNDGINLYFAMDYISKHAGDATFITDSGASFHVTPQAAFIKEGQRFIMAGSGPMGFAIPAAIGVSVASKNGKVIAFTGDGSLQQTATELQTITHNKLPIKLFVLNNKGYFSMKPVIERGIDSAYLYNQVKENISFPNFAKLAEAYNIKHIKIKTVEDLEECLEENIFSDEPIFFEVITSNNLDIYTTTTRHNTDGSISSVGIECMFPFLNESELMENMTIKNFMR